MFAADVVIIFIVLIGVCYILTRMLVSVSKSHRKGLGKHGKNIKTKFR